MSEGEDVELMRMFRREIVPSFILKRETFEFIAFLREIVKF